MSEAAEFYTEEMTLNMGPQHPSTHGVLRFVLKTDGEVLREVKPVVGYLHRGLEKIAEMVTYPQFMPYTDRVDYLAAMFCNEGYARAVEKLADIEVPPRALYLRVIAAELNRIINHLVAVGCMGLDLGAITPFVHTLREREWFNDRIEELCGARLTYNYSRIGGVAYDLPEGLDEKILGYLDHFEQVIDEYNRLLSFNKIFIHRMAGVAPIPAEMAVDYGLVGPNLRASGVNWDLRRDEPYGAYPDFYFEVPVGEGAKGAVGDCYDRYWVRIGEMRESCRILRQAFGKLPEGDIQTKLPRNFKPPVGEAYAAVESARGELGYYLISDGGNKPYRLKIRTGSFAAMSIVEEVAPNLMLADLVALIASFDVIAPEVDR